MWIVFVETLSRAVLWMGARNGICEGFKISERITIERIFFSVHC